MILKYAASGVCRGSSHLLEINRVQSFTLPPYFANFLTRAACLVTAHAHPPGTVANPIYVHSLALAHPLFCHVQICVNFLKCLTISLLLMKEMGNYTYLIQFDTFDTILLNDSIFTSYQAI